MKKLSILLTLLLLPLAAAMAEEAEIDGIRYNLDAGTKQATVIQKTVGNDEGDISIPASVDYGGVSYSVTAIGDYAFFCGELTSVYIPNSVTSIGDWAFSNCNSLKAFTVDSANGYYKAISGVLFNKEGTILVSYPKGRTGYSYSIPNGVTTIGDNAFFHCDGLTSIEIPNSVTTIGFQAFVDCRGLTSIEIPNSVTSIGNDAFSCCNGLTSVYIPNSVTTIGRGAFQDCDNLTSVTIETKTPLTIYGGTFTSSADATLYVPAGSKAAYEAADYWKDFKEIIEMVPIEFADANVKAICVANWDVNGDGELSEVEAAVVTDLGEVFKDNAEIISFDELAYFSGLTSIGNSAFSGCTSLASVTIPSSVTSIGNEAFADCISLTSIEIPNSVTSIGEWAFASGLTSIVIPNSVTTIGQFAFAYSDLTSVTIGNSVTSISEDAFYSCSDLTEIIVASDNTKYDSRDNCNAIIETATNKLVVGCKNSKIPNTVTTIGYRAFEDCDGLTSVDIPNSVINIGYQAFQSCSGLTTIVIPNSVTTISSQAFCNIVFRVL